MAAIAKFVSFDGGIAFSDSVLKIQKRDEERGRLIPIENITGIEVDEPLLGDDGCVRVQIAGKRPSTRNTIYFNDDQYNDALGFQAAFVSFMRRSSPVLPPLEMFQPTSIAKRPQRERPRYTEPERRSRPIRQPRRRGRFRWWYVAIVVVFIAILATPGKKENEQEQQESAMFAETELPESPEPTVEPTPEATPFVGYTSPPAMTSPPAVQETVQTETMVWIPTNGGTKYHRTSGCSNMDNPQQVTLSEAQSRGFTPCKRCY